MWKKNNIIISIKKQKTKINLNVVNMGKKKKKKKENKIIIDNKKNCSRKKACENAMTRMHESCSPGGGGGTPHIKGVGMLVENFELNP